MTFAALREANVKRCEDVFHKLDAWSPTDWATAFAGEAGEACNLIKKLRRLDDTDSVIDTLEARIKLIENIGKELADTMIYADLLAARLGLDLGVMIRSKFNEVSVKRGSNILL